MRFPKGLFWLVTVVGFAWWVIPLRNVANRQGLYRIEAWLNNIPNALTVIRGIAAIPVVAIFSVLLWQQDPHADIWFFIVIGMFLLDAIDGPLARMLGYVTEFGREADPTVDKLLVAALALALPVLCFRLQGPIAGIVIATALAWLIMIEQRVARLGIRTSGLARQLESVVHGAYTSGKIKFNLEALAFVASFGFLTWSPHRLEGTLIAAPLFCVARHFADMSLIDHTRECSRLEVKLAEHYSSTHTQQTGA